MMNKWFPQITDETIAKHLCKQGAIGALIFAAMNALGAAFAYFFNSSPVNARTIDASAVNNQIVGTLVTVPVILFIAYRIHSGKGWIAAALLMLWFAIEAILKIAGGTANVGWIFFYLAVIGTLANGLRACWWLRNVDSSQNP